MLDALTLSTLGYVLIIISLFMYGSDHFGGEGVGKKGVILTLLGFILLLLSVWVG